jgi:hypothetical protein
MLLNVFSLHRTGSTWWAQYLQSQHPNSKIYNETFNECAYFTVDKNKVWTSYSEYADGRFYRIPNKKGTKLLDVFAKSTIEQEAERLDRWLNFFKLSKHTIVCHTHITPIQDEKYLTELSKIGDKNYYVYRENIFEQIASFIILKHTGEYGVTTVDKSLQIEKYTYPIIDIPMIEWMCYEILRADKLVEDKLVNIQRVRYESMPFEKTLPGMPLKQNVSAFNRLCIIDQTLIKQIYNRVKNGK